MDINKIAAVRIKELRISQGITAKSVASELDIAISNYSKLENGKVEITLSKLQSLSKIFKIPLVDLIEKTNQADCDNDKELILTLKQSMQLIEQMLQQKSS
jgi:transcriptional regulator with XRE-family HTH domain